MIRLKKLFFPLLIVAIFAVSFLWFFPKTSAWYYAESLLKEAQIILDQEQIEESGFWLHLREGNLYLQGLEAARIKEVTLCVGLLVNSMTISDLYPGKSAKMVSDFFMKKLEVRHHIFAPLSFSIEAEGNFGSMQGSFDTSTRTIDLLIEASPLLQSKSFLMRMLKKEDKGYRFVRTF